MIGARAIIVVLAWGAWLCRSALGAAAGPAAELGEVQRAIAEKGLDWQTADYGTSFPLGALREKVRSENHFTPSTDNLLAAVDWRNNGGNFVSPVKDQGNCGSCWAFAAVGSLESLIAIAGNTPGSFLDLSEQILVSCCSGNLGCSGGYMSVTASFMKNYGTYLETCFPYTAANTSCSNACSGWQSLAYQTGNYWLLTQSADALKAAVATYGPVQVTMDVYGDFYNYASGVYEYATGTYQGGHAILCVGYADTSGQYGGGYFICKNSWGADWGESGFFRIGYSQITNSISFGSDSYVYVYSGEPGPTPVPTPVPDMPTLTVNGPTAAGSISPAGEKDWFRFVVATSGTHTIESWAGTLLDNYMYLYGPNSQTALIDSDDDSGEGLAAKIVWILSPGTYYVMMQAYDSSGTGTYTIGVTGAGGGGGYVPGDYTGDGVADVAVFRPATGLWVIRNHTRVNFGGSGDIPVPADYDGDGRADLAVYRPALGMWSVRNLTRVYFGNAASTPQPTDYDGDGRADFAVYNGGVWMVRNVTRVYLGGAADIPVTK